MLGTTFTVVGKGRIGKEAQGKTRQRTTWGRVGQDKVEWGVGMVSARAKHNRCGMTG